MATINNFTPLATTSVSVSGTHAEGTLTTPTAPVNTSVRVYNATTVTVFIKFGVAGIAAATTDTPIPAGAVEVFDIGPNITTISGITAGTSGTLYATTGMGT